jgi:hypothetical protein
VLLSATEQQLLSVAEEGNLAALEALFVHEGANVDVGDEVGGCELALRKLFQIVISEA